MRENIEILQTRKTQYQNYKSFVEMVEQRVKLVHSTLKAPALPARTEWKATASPQAIRAKIVTEAIQKREKVPIEYRPTFKQELLTKNFKATLSASVSPLAITPSTKPIQAVLKGEDFKRPDKSFTIAVNSPLKDNAARAVWHKEVAIQIRSLDKVRPERTPIKIQEPMESPKVWKVEANEKGKIILERMQADIRERKAEIPKSNPDGFCSRFNNPSKRATDEEAIQKVRTEAKTARASVRHEYRASPSPHPKESLIQSSFDKSWSKAIQNESKEMKKFSSKFNASSGADKVMPKPSNPLPDQSL